MRIWRYLISLALGTVIYAFLLMPLRMRPPGPMDIPAVLDTVLGAVVAILGMFFYLGPWVILYHAMTSMPFLVYVNRKGVDPFWRSAGVACISAFPMLFTPLAIVAAPLTFGLGWIIGWINGPVPEKRPRLQ
ncbi:hypothetical protein [Kordiimonas aestuarii]|uniref:hypothetical protein n=1 Tax=Kordiimonas aestuarii TaxID=1005925 RepID=UPI0021CE3E43|nr:hypothetical protein [Kordiimonas aestuarii]